MQRVAAPSHGAPMQPFGLTFMATALALRDLLLDAPVKVTGLELLTLAGGYGVLKSKIQADGLLGGYEGF
jgi:hypothetical protein